MKIKINPKYEHLRDKIQLIPVLFSQKGEVIYEARNVLKRVSVDGLEIVVKSFKQPHIINRIAYTFFRKSKALRSYIYSSEIINCGFVTPEPIAVIEEFEGGLLTHSYYVCRYDDGETVRALMSGTVEGNEEKLKAFTRYTVELHRAGILHLDYSPGNILIHPNENGYRFSLVDVNRLALIKRISPKQVAVNLRRLCTSREVLNYISGEYAAILGWDVDRMQKKATAYSDRFFADFMFRRTAKRIHGMHIPMAIFRFKIYRRFRRVIGDNSFTRLLYQKEKQMYDAFFAQYDYREVFKADYAD